jgi:hypothetical protein
MKIGTKSVLFGAHCFFLHPWFVAVAWWRLYGFPFDPRLWIAFVVHDIGYLGKPNMDGAEGETHVEFGAKVMGLFGEQWANFTRYHSRFYAKKDGVQYTRLCVADKLAICLTPAWLYLPMVNWTGEIGEYMAMSKANGNTKYAFMSIDAKSQCEWHANMCRYLRDWVAEHRDLKVDVWTSANRRVRDASGVIQ